MYAALLKLCYEIFFIYAPGCSFLVMHYCVAYNITPETLGFSGPREMSGKHEW